MFDSLADAMEDEPLSDDDLLTVGNEAVAIIADRTKRGVDVEHNIFRPYSYDYAKERLAKSLNSFPVDLTRTGRMLGALMASPAGEGTVRVGFADEHANFLAGIHNAGAEGRTAVNEFVRQVPKRTRSGGYRKYRRGEERVLTTVHGHTLAVNLPRREFVDVRHPEELERLGETVGRRFVIKIEELVKP